MPGASGPAARARSSRSSSRNRCRATAASTCRRNASTALGLLWWVGVLADRGSWYLGGLVAAAVLFIYQQWLIRDRERAACFRAFLNNHYLGMLVFAGLFADYQLSDYG